MSLIRRTNQKTFNDIYSTYTLFNEDLTNTFSVFKPSDVTDEYITKTYYLLVANYGDTPINSYLDENRWKLKLFSLIDEYTPEWMSKCEMQKQIRSMSLEDFKSSDKTIYNNALNPNTSPSTNELTELTYINSQNTTNRLLSDASAIERKWDMLFDGLNKDYINHFKILFSKFTMKDVPLYTYENGGDEDE